MEITAGRKPVVIYREPYRPYKRHPKYKGFLALYVHYLYVLGQIQKQQYPPRMTPQLKQDIMRFEQLQGQFKFLQKYGIETESQMQKFQAELQTKMAALTKQRTILNVRKKKQKSLFQALADERALVPAKELYEAGQAGFEAEYQRYEMYYLDLATGMRRGELLGLKWEDIDFGHGVIHIRRQVARLNSTVQEAPLKTKNSYRNISIGADAVELLRKKREQDNGKSVYVFPSPTGGPLAPDSVLHMLHRVLERAGLPKIRFHDLRHTFATLALQNGVDIKTVSGMLGHFSAGFTLDTYAHVTTAAQREAANVISGVLSK